MIPIQKHTSLPSHRRSVHPNTAPLHVCSHCATRPLERKETPNLRVTSSHPRMDRCASFPADRLTVTTLIGDTECQTKGRSRWTVHQPTLTDDGARMSSQRLEGRKKIRVSRGEQGGEGEGGGQEEVGFCICVVAAAAGAAVYRILLCSCVSCGCSRAVRLTAVVIVADLQLCSHVSDCYRLCH